VHLSHSLLGLRICILSHMKNYSIGMATKLDGDCRWQDICTEKRNKRNNLIPMAWRLKRPDELMTAVNCGILSNEEVSITSEYDAVGIVEAIRQNLFTVEAVTIAFCKRAAIAQQLVRVYPLSCGNIC